MDPATLSLITAIISYFLQDRSTPEKQKQALLVSSLIGAGTYAYAEKKWPTNPIEQLDDTVTAPTTGSTGTSVSGTGTGSSSIFGSFGGGTTTTGGPSASEIITTVTGGAIAGAAASSLGNYLVPIGLLLAFVWLAK